MAREFERASPSDRAFLAMDSGEVPEQFGVILMLDEGGELDLERARRLLAERVPAVPRLRQRLISVPPGCGGPIWIDARGFDINRHVRAVACREPGDEPALLETALSVIMSPLPRSAPLWAAVLVTGPGGNALALVIVLHHALADGVGGLAVLTELIDGAARAPEVSFPRPAPAPASLAREAFAARLRALRHAARSWHLLRESMGAGGGLRPPRAVPSSLNQPTGPYRQLAVVRAGLAAVQTAAHRHGATTNDAVLIAVAGALHQVLLRRGETVGSFVVTVPVSGRRPDGGPQLGNMVSPLLVSVPATGDVPGRLRQVAAQVRVHKQAATGPPPIALLGWLFRPLAALGGFRWYMDHQHRFHTLVSHVRGPVEPVTFGGCRIISAIPAGVGPGGNIPVYFEVLSYAGTLTVSAIADHAQFPELDALADALRTELDLVIQAVSAPVRPGAGSRARTPLLGLRRKPGRLALAMFRMPLRAYRHDAGWLLGHTFMEFVHTGRKTGRPYETVAMVLRYDADADEAVICAGWGPDTDWVRNLRAGPAAQVRLGRESFTPLHRFLSDEEAFDVVARFRLEHPRRVWLISTILGWGDLRDDTAVRGFIRTHPFVAFRPATTSPG
jgi:diacylglycerol O-acyltransferase / wax synthase